MLHSPVPITAAAAIAILLLPGCARQAYAPRALDRDAAVAAYESRRVDDPGLQRYMLAHGHPESDWPVREWGLDQLTLLAFFSRPELEVARAQSRATRAEVDVAAQRPPFGVSPRIEHHSEHGAEDTPWSVGFDVSIPLGGQSQRAALVERAEYLAQLAELHTGRQAWAVRSSVRARLLDMHAARQRIANLESELEQQRAAQGLLERRLDAGYASVTDLDVVRLRVAQAQADLAAARTTAQLATGALAEALGVPLLALREMTLSFSAFEVLPALPDERAVRASALTNRVDLRGDLLGFAAADAAVKIQIARQYPAFALRPGYLWDQGDNVWSLALDLVVPATLTYGPAIRAAEAAREASAQQALARQQTVIAEAASRAATYAQARDSAAAALAASRTQLARSSQLQRQFDIGQADRLELTLGRAEALVVERRSIEALVDAQRHLGALEDAMQAPLTGGPVPAPPSEDR
jgi:cobalt-zinc-cadmium efflux system outer membrane protein